MSNIKQKLKQHNIILPIPAKPVANYLPWIKSGTLVFISGQLPIENGQVKFTGKVNTQISIENAVEAARICGINIITQLNHACEGNLEKVTRCVKLGGFVNSEPDFNQQPKVINGCSDLMVAIFEEKGQHARFAVSANSLPLDATVEIDAVFEVE